MDDSRPQPLTSKAGWKDILFVQLVLGVEGGDGGGASSTAASPLVNPVLNINKIVLNKIPERPTSGTVFARS